MTWQYRSDEQNLQGAFMNTVVGPYGGPTTTKLHRKRLYQQNMDRLKATEESAEQ